MEIPINANIFMYNHWNGIKSLVCSVEFVFSITWSMQIEDLHSNKDRVYCILCIGTKVLERIYDFLQNNKNWFKNLKFHNNFWFVFRKNAHPLTNTGHSHGKQNWCKIPILVVSNFFPWPYRGVYVYGVC